MTRTEMQTTIDALNCLLALGLLVVREVDRMEGGEWVRRLWVREVRR